MKCFRWRLRGKVLKLTSGIRARSQTSCSVYIDSIPRFYYRMPSKYHGFSRDMASIIYKERALSRVNIKHNNPSSSLKLRKIEQDSSFSQGRNCVLTSPLITLENRAPLLVRPVAFPILFSPDDLMAPSSRINFPKINTLLLGRSWQFF